MGQPEKKFRTGGLSATIWKKDGVKDGKAYSMFTVTLDRSYKQGEEWKNSNALRTDDLPKAVALLNEAYRYLSFGSGKSET